jgi:hypothetical protein
MTGVLRRIDAPTRYGGLSLKGWLGAMSALLALVLLVRVLRTPLMPTLVAVSWFVAAPSIVLLMWAHQQGVSVPTLAADFLRFTLRGRRAPLTHDPCEVLRGGVVIAGDLARERAPGHARAPHDLAAVRVR